MKSIFKYASFLLGTLFLTIHAFSSERARDLGIEFEGVPGQFNAITDVPGVKVGYSTIIFDEPTIARTGVSAIFPRGEKDSFDDAVMASSFVLNGNGEMTGTTWVNESGFLNGPIMVTNTHSVGMVHHSLIKWAIEKGLEIPSLPVVAETWDGFLNDINALHVKEKHVYEALNNPKSGAIEEGNVGSGTGMICYLFKGGIGTASRITEIEGKEYTVGVWVQANHGLREELTIRGIPFGKMQPLDKSLNRKNEGSIIIVIATDAPLLPIQLNRLAKRAALGLARTGSIAHNSSGDIFIAFSTANKGAISANGLMRLNALKNNQLDNLFQAVVEATEEAIINALVAAEPMEGKMGITVEAVDRKRLKVWLDKKSHEKNLI